MKIEAPGAQAILGVGSLIIFGGVMLALTFQPIPDANQQLYSTALGLLGGTMIGGAWGFFFGTNKDSQAKSAALADQASALRQAAPAAAAAALAGGGGVPAAVEAEGTLTLTPAGAKPEEEPPPGPVKVDE